MIGPGEIFTLFFVMLGPLKVLGPFAQQTHGLELSAARAIAWRAFVLSLATVAIGGWGGAVLAVKWHISIPTMLIATGIVFFLVALRVVLEPYTPSTVERPPLPAQPVAAALSLTFPALVTPYGVAALITLLVANEGFARREVIWGMLLVVMILNLLAMLYARSIMHGWPTLVLRLLGAVLGVLQVALAVQIVLRGLRQASLLAAA